MPPKSQKPKKPGSKVRHKMDDRVYSARWSPPIVHRYMAYIDIECFETIIRDKFAPVEVLCYFVKLALRGTITPRIHSDLVGTILH
jgi:hypothetical protein